MDSSLNSKSQLQLNLHFYFINANQILTNKNTFVSRLLLSCNYCLYLSNCKIGVVCRVVASNARDPRFKSSHRQNLHVLSTVLKRQKKEKILIMTPLRQKYIFCAPFQISWRSYAFVINKFLQSITSYAEMKHHDWSNIVILSCRVQSQRFISASHTDKICLFLRHSLLHIFF